MIQVNDITAGESDHRILDFVASERISVVLMHSRGDPKTMDTLTGITSQCSFVFA